MKGLRFKSLKNGIVFLGYLNCNASYSNAVKGNCVVAITISIIVKCLQ